METSVDMVGAQAAVQMEKISQNQQKAQGSAVVHLIRAAEVPPPPTGPDGRGARVNRYA